MKRPLSDRFWEKVQKSADPDGCWLWVGAKVPCGYGSIATGNNVQKMAHRLSWEFAHGVAPAGKMVLHRCDVRACVNPAHLFLGDAKANAQDMVRKGRQPRGKTHGLVLHPERVAYGRRLRQTKVSEEAARALKARKRAGERTTTLAAEYGISESQVLRIARGARREV